MSRTDAYSEKTALNVRLAVRQAVSDICASPERTVEWVVNSQFGNSAGPIRRLIAARLENIYEQLQSIILSPSNQPLSSTSLLRFLCESDDMSEEQIVRRFEKDNMLTRRQELEEWQKVGTPLLTPIHPAPPLVDIPRLEELSSGRSSRNYGNQKHQKFTKNGKKPNFVSSSECSSTVASSASTDKVWSKSASDSSMEGSSNPREIEHSGRKGIFPEKKTSASSPRHQSRLSPKSKKTGEGADNCEESSAEIREANNVISVLLKKESIPTAPSLEEKATNTTTLNEKAKVLANSCSSLRSDDDKVTVRYMPSKVLSADVAISTDSLVFETKPAKSVDVGVNTTVEIGSVIADGSSSSNTASDNSAGQLPKQLFDAILQRPSLTIVSLRPDGSIVPGNMSASRRLPTVHEWVSASSKANVELPVSAPGAGLTGPAAFSDSEENEEERLDNSKFESISASISRPEPSEDLNTMANISPIPHS